MSWNPITWFPFGKDGRATLIYMAFAGSVPAITGVIVWALYQIRWFDAPALDRLERFYQVTMWLAYGFMIGMSAYAAFVSFRAFKASKEGFEFTSKDDEDVVQ
jgi:cytochrome b subunit of formate dehydrogenase